MFSQRTLICATVSLYVALLSSVPAWSVYIDGVLPVAMDQPMINCYFSLSSGGVPLSNPDGDPTWGIPYFNVNAYYDTGASGILLSYETADYLSVHKSYAGSQLVVYEDVGVGGSDQFNVSQPVYIALASNPNDPNIDDLAAYHTTYNQQLGAVRTQIATAPVDPNSLLGPLDVIGIPAMQGKVVVIDPKPLDDIYSFAGINTYVYNPGTTYRPVTADTDPGIPATNRHIRLSYAPFGSFSKVTPSGAAGPTLAANPFIGPNPVAKLYGLPVDNTPGLTVSLGGLKATGSFLFDTGAMTSMISTALAAELHVRYVGGSQDSDTLEMFDPARPGWTGTIPNQFTMEVGGVGGTVTAAGFYLDSMLLRTLEGDPNNDADPNHLVFRNVPVLVDDISVQNPVTLQTLTLDGVFGVNNYVAGMTPDMGDIGTGNFNWIVFNQPKGLLGFDAKSIASATWSGNASPADATWSNAANWGDTAAAVGAALSFGQISSAGVANSNDFPAGTQFAGINFDGNAAFNLQGNRISLAGAVVNLSTQTQTISLDMTLSGSACTFYADSNDIVVIGHIDGNQGLVKNGGAKLILKAANTYTGDTTISGGVIQADSGDGLPAASLLKLDGGVLQNIAAPTFSRVLGPAGGAFQWTANGGGFSAGANALSVNVGGSSAQLVWGTAVGSQIVGTLMLSSSTATNSTTFQNPIDLNGAVRTIEVDDNPASSADYAVLAKIVSNSSGTAAGLTKTGAGLLELTTVNTYNGPTTISAGTLALSGNGQINPLSTIDNDARFLIADDIASHSLGTITGTGTTQLNNGAQLTATSIVQGVLTIGSGATVTIQPINFSPAISWKGGDSFAPTDWGVAANWISNTVPAASAGTKVSFGKQPAANNVVDMISQGQTVGNITFFADTSTTIQSLGGFALTLDNSGSVSTIDVAGSHIISAPVVLHNDATISGTGTLNLSGGITGSYDLEVDIDLTATSIRVDTLTIGSGATVTIQAIPGGPLALSENLTSVSEPSTLALLGIGAIILLAYGWRRRWVA